MRVTNTGPSSKPSLSNGLTWGVFAAVIVLFAAYVIAQLAAGFGVSLYPLLHHWTAARSNAWLDNSIVAQFLYVLGSEGLLVLLIYFFVRWRKGSLAAMGWRHPKWRDAGFAALGLLAYLALYAVAASVLSALAHLNVGQRQDIGFQNPSGALALTLTFLSLVAVPPLAEEFAFRGFLFSAARRRLGFVAGALLTSVLFAVPHLLESGNGSLLWIAGLDTFVMSLVVCYLREETGRLWAGVLVHMLKNGLAFVSLFVFFGR